MSLQVVAKHIEPPEPGGTDDDGDYEGWACEACGSVDFRLPVWRGAPLIVCVDCSKPQDWVIWVESGHE